MDKINTAAHKVNNNFLICTLKEILESNQLKDISAAPAWYKMIWVQKGNVIVQTLSKKQEVDKAHVYYFSEALVDVKISDNAEAYLVFFSSNFFYLMQQEFKFIFSAHNSCQASSLIFMNEDVLYETGEILCKLYKEFHCFSMLSTEITKGLFSVFLLYLSKNIYENTSFQYQSRETAIMHKFQSLLNKYITTKKLVADYANELHVTPGYLNIIVKKASGFTASYHIQQQIIKQAKQKALYSFCSMKKIAYELGFDDTAHFSKFFKNNSGLNFTDFKKELMCL